MSALDQALTKAYAKNRPAAKAAETSSGPAPTAPVRRAPVGVGSRTSISSVERIYHDGSLYRVEIPANVKKAAVQIQPPHVKMLPPTSPRRSIRRSLQRLAATQSASVPAEITEPSPRIARKVIIRHISHAAAPAPLGLLRASIPVPPPAYELPSDTFIDDPLPDSPVGPPQPDTAPLNLAVESVCPIQILGDWDHAGAIAPLTLISHCDESESPWSVVSVELEAISGLEEAAQLAARAAETPPAEHSFRAKELEDAEEPRVRFRVDAAHSSRVPTPHGKFGADNSQEQERAKPVDEDSAATTDSVPISDAVADPTPELTFSEPLEIENLTFAELSSEPTARDLASAAAQEQTAEQFSASVAAEDKSPPPAASLWEVDRFHWPRTCDKLFNDEKGYLSQAGDKLAAAVQDGLRVLAITGTRRGEGRTTLALCLARAAAQAGIQVAVMDADFARPQLASKIALEVAYGWQDAALGRIPLSEAAIKSLHDGITALPLESALVTRGLSLADPRVTATIRAAAATFELLILDLGPIGAADRLAFPPGEASPLDAAIVVRDLRFATATESGTLCETLQDAGIEAVGIAENFVVEEELPVTSV